MGMWEIDEKNLMNQIRMMKSKGWVTNIEIETIKRKIGNQSGDEINEGTKQESDIHPIFMMKMAISTMQIVQRTHKNN